MSGKSKFVIILEQKKTNTFYLKFIWNSHRLSFKTSISKNGKPMKKARKKNTKFVVFLMKLFITTLYANFYLKSEQM